MSRLRAGLRARLRDRRDAGTTLVELLVVMVVLGIVMASVQGMIFLANKTSTDVSNRVTTTGDAKVAMDAMSKNLRTAVLPQLVANATCTGCATIAFVQGTPTSVQFYANNNADPARLGPTKVSYVLTNGTLTERIQKPDPHAPTVYNYTYCNPGPSCQVAERVLARNVASTTLFGYYDRAGAAITGANLNAAQLSRVDSIDVTVTVRANPTADCSVPSGECTTVVQRVTLPNADSVPEITTTATP